jgi:hypothetical protein
MPDIENPTRGLAMDVSLSQLTEHKGSERVVDGAILLSAGKRNMTPEANLDQ